jgi:serine/threonine-protein kinase RsbT
MVLVQKNEVREIRVEQDVVAFRQTTRIWAADLGFSPIDQTKIVTATSELARNTLTHGRGGTARLEKVADGRRIGLRAIFEDQGPGIEDPELALRDGYSTGSGLGLGLGGSRRLVDDFELQTEPGVGTRVTVTKWK